MDTAADVGKSVLRWASSALTDARYKVEGMYGTEIERKTKEATSNESWGSSGTLKNEIARATFDYGESYDQIMTIIWERLEANSWRVVFKTLTLLDHLIRNGSKRVVDECRIQIYRIRLLNNFFKTDEDGIDRGKTIRALAKRICQMLDDNRVLRRARDKTQQQNRQFSASAPATSFSSSPNANFSDYRSSFFSDYRSDYIGDRTNSNHFKKKDNFASEKIETKNKDNPFISRNKNKQEEKSNSFRARPEKTGKREDLIDMAGDNFAEDVGKKDSKGDEKAKENEIDLLDIELEGGDFTERFQEKDGVDKNDGRASASNSLDLIDSLSPSFDKLQIEGDPKKAAKNLFETENHKIKSSEKDVLAKSQNIADEKLKQMIPGSDLVDLEGLMKRGSKGTFRSKDKKRMNQM